MSDSTLRMSFDPNTIEHLGIKMYSQIPNAIAELIANAYDADASTVQIKLHDDDLEKSIEVIDDGMGMDFDEINQKFLRIGRNRRKDNENLTSKGRKATGKKGLGKLALFGIGDLIEVSTTKENSGDKIKFTLDWDELKNTHNAEYSPHFERQQSNKAEKGTTIALKKLRRESAFEKENLAISLSKLFNFFSSEFRCFISHNDDEPIEISNTLRFKNIDAQFTWDFPSFSDIVDPEYAYKTEIAGEIISTEKPLRPGLRGITLFANGRLVNAAEFFGIPESSHVFSYLTGWLNIDFIDNLDEDAISTNRQSLNWDLPVASRLHSFLSAAVRKVIAEWRIKRNEANRKTVETTTNINTEKWYSTLPDQIKSDVQVIVDSMITESEAPTESQANIIRMVHKLVPEYPQYHWRHLHTDVQDASKDDYKNQDYYRAFIEAVKRYITITRANSQSTQPNDSTFMGNAFGENKPLSVTKKYRKPNGSNFSDATITAIEEGQKFLSMGIIMGARNPISHEEIVDLRDSNLFNEKDCLDALSILSHLFRRLEDAIEASDGTQNSTNP
ncbi:MULTISPECIES: TIGR02391 family protein [unclassified Polynucleobacter]|uniref:TIGR02391 family protein n=1 Tax=unclassified Polynucleobacter TaxID=2640945 RepID=UPI0008C3CC8C|nr:MULTISPECIES: TIGR02391 family protein [unclassified Polynucleobacter]MBU3591210.1 TIGR02391 family protein [Polynucleobacter sp. 78F-HAINBA]OHC09982.1 MAG: TIGR02391 family protein [Polynucleobacter sp. GWA2_45_21]HBK43042.1 TIGR02391 family protein [Polynucleobacter sp.]